MADSTEFQVLGHPEEEKKVSPGVEKPSMAQVLWERFTKTLDLDRVGYKAERAGVLGIQVRDLHFFILLLYNDINKTLRPGPHREPPTKEEIQKCLESYGETDEDAKIDRDGFKAFLEAFTKNAIRRNELVAFFKAVHSGAHTKQVPDCSSQEPGPSSRQGKAEDCEEPLMKKLKQLKNSDGRTDSAVNLNSFSGGSHFQIFNFAGADLDSLATFVKQIRK